MAEDRAHATPWIAWWGVAAAVAALAGAAWLRRPAVPYLGAATAATLLAGVLAGICARRGRGYRPVIATVALFAFCLAGAQRQRAIAAIDGSWSNFAAEGENRARRLFTELLAAAAADAEERAEAALGLRLNVGAGLPALASERRGERAIILFESGRAVSWAGYLRTPIVADSDGVRVVESPFYLTMYAVRSRGTRRAVATVLLQARAPADRLARALDVTLPVPTAVRGVGLRMAGSDDEPAASTESRFAWRGVPLVGVRVIPAAPAEARLRAVQHARVLGAVLLAIAMIAVLGSLWARPAGLGQRLAALALGLLALAIVPLNAFSNLSPMFDASFYFARLGGPFTANAGALLAASALVLLGLLAVLRSRARLRSRTVALLVVVVLAGLGPFLLRDLARGIAPPPWGVSAGLWLAWQLPVCLVAVSVLLAGSSAGRVALGPWRGLPPIIAPAIAATAALLAPVLWQAPGRWPGWYPVFWVLAIGALALTRRTRALVLTAATVASCGAAALVWGATVRQRTALAVRAASGLTAPDPAAAALAERFAQDLALGPAPRTRAALLRRYAESELASARYPVELSSWSANDSAATATVSLGLSGTASAARRAVREAASGGSAVLAPTIGETGALLTLAYPWPDGTVTSATVAPLLSGTLADPLATLLGLADDAGAEPLYSLVVTSDRAQSRGIPGRPQWRRVGNELHGDWSLQAARGPVRAHLEVELRPLDVLVQRGTLVVLLDLALVALLWALAALADGAVPRWLRRRRRRWSRSYRSRLTIALFTFFVIPAVAFATWSYRRLQQDDLRARELLVRESLRAAAGERPTGALQPGTTLLVYERGELAAATDSLYTALAPTGRFLPPRVQARFAEGGELFVSDVQRVAGIPTVFGYRAATAPDRTPITIAAPARSAEIALDRQRRDLGVLVLFATAMGALAALALSGAAARQFASPIGRLRAAALAIARGDREPPLTGDVPAEFAPVFSAFRRMARDLSESRTALEAAQRRTAAVLRNVASGVIAVDDMARVVLANPRAEQLLAVPVPAGASIDELEVPALAAEIRAFGASNEDERELDVARADRQLHARLTRLARGGTVLTLDDVTELARAQRVLAWGEMARQIAHEIKNPLTPIRLGVQHLRRARAAGRPDFDEILETNVGRILSEIDRLDEIARTFSRYGTAPAERPLAESVDVRAVVHDVVGLERLGEGSVDWRLDTPPDALYALARADELREALLNVLENARLAGARTVTVALATAGPRAQVEVVDDGEGIAPETLSRVFEPHFSTRTSGSGLGLAVSRRVIDGWGGEITIASRLGEGTRVTIHLRLA